MPSVFASTEGDQSLAQIAYTDIGKVAGTAAIAAILFIIVIALAGLGKVVVKALGGEEVVYPPGSTLVLAKNDGIFVGISSGATFAAALKVAREAGPGSVTLAMLPDTGERYLSTALFKGISDGGDPEPA